MKYMTHLLMLTAVACAGCDSSDDYKLNSVSSPTPVAQQTDFSSFVIAQYSPSASAETAAAVEVEATDFSYVDNDNPTVFGSLIATAP